MHCGVIKVGKVGILKAPSHQVQPHIFILHFGAPEKNGKGSNKFRAGFQATGSALHFEEPGG